MVTPVLWRRKRRQLWSLTLERSLSLSAKPNHCTAAPRSQQGRPSPPSLPKALRVSSAQATGGGFPRRNRFYALRAIPLANWCVGWDPPKGSAAIEKKLVELGLVQKKNISKPSIRSLETCLRRQQHIHPRAEDFTRGTNLARFEEHRRFSQCLSSFSPKRRQGRFPFGKEPEGEKIAAAIEKLTREIATVCSRLPTRSFSSAMSSPLDRPLRSRSTRCKSRSHNRQLQPVFKSVTQLRIRVRANLFSRL